MLERLHLRFATKAGETPAATFTRLVKTVMHKGDIAPLAAARLADALSDDDLRTIDAGLKGDLLSAFSPSIENKDRGWKKMRKVGRRLVRSIILSPGFIDAFAPAEDRLAKGLARELLGADMSRALDPQQDISAQDCAEFVQRAARHFAHAFEMRNGIHVNIINDEKYPNSGEARWEVALNQVAIDINICNIKKIGQLPHLLLTLAHEGVHGFIAEAQRVDLAQENLGHKRRDLEQILAVFDKTFYSAKIRELYKNHPEEILAESVGIRSATKFARALGLDPKIHHFTRSVELYPRGEVVRELARLHRADSLKP